MTGLSRRGSRVRVPSLPFRKTCKQAYSVAGLDTASAHAPHIAHAWVGSKCSKTAPMASHAYEFKPFAPRSETDSKRRPATTQNGRRSRPRK
jgi:hypothetical protein